MIPALDERADPPFPRGGASALTIAQQKRFITQIQASHNLNWRDIRSDLPAEAGVPLVIYVTARAQAAGPRPSSGGVLPPIRPGEGIRAVHNGDNGPAAGGAAGRRNANQQAGALRWPAPCMQNLLCGVSTHP